MIGVFSEWLSAFGADRAKALVDDRIVDRVYAKLWPYDAAAVSNLDEWNVFRSKGVPLWGWAVCSPDQVGDAAGIRVLDAAYRPDGWVLNIEKPLEHVDLDLLVSRVAALGRPVVASLAGGNPNHCLYDHRTFDRYGVTVEWQAYADSGEGPPPDVAVSELYAPSRLLAGREYRAGTWPTGDRRSAKFGWGALVSRQKYSSYNRNTDFLYGGVVDRSSWPEVTVPYGRGLVAQKLQGTLLGLAAYPQIRASLIITESIEVRRSLAEWTAYASTARAPGASLRGLTVYLAERCSDDVLRAIALAR